MLSAYRPGTTESLRKRENERVSDAGTFVDRTLQAEGDPYRAAAEKGRLGSDLQFYGASVGAVRGTIRDVAHRYPGLTRDDITALSSELWAMPVFERQLAAVVLLQSNLRVLDNSDLTRIEGFVRSAYLRELVDPLAIDVVGPLVERLAAPARARANSALDRWVRDSDRWVRRAAVLTPLRSLRAGTGDWPRFARNARMLLEESAQNGSENENDNLVLQAITLVLSELATHRPQLHL